jgi:ubiquinone/menaquinone biosynthesis C-methylase UbiE
MKESSLNLICSPVTGKPLSLEKGNLIEKGTGRKFPVIKGIPALIDQNDVTGMNRKYQHLYDILPFVYDIIALIGNKFFNLGAPRSEIINGLGLKENDLVLDVSVGTGLMLYHSRVKAQFFGVDLSLGMLQKCRKNLRKWKIDAELFQANAEALPFRDGIFDAVTHFGGINFFNNKKRAIDEMIRVARPGAKIAIGDETIRQVRNIPAIFRKFYETKDPGLYDPPVNLIPPAMLDISVKFLRNGDLYALSFRKP